MTIELSTPDELKYQFQPVHGGFCSFTVKAPNDAHIALTREEAEVDPMYEVFIGGWSNSKSVIRKNRVKPDVVTVDTPDILSEHEFKGFWIRWSDHEISVGKEGSSEPFMTHTDAEIINVKYMGFCTGWGAKGTWVINNKLSKYYWEKAANGQIPDGVVTAGKDPETGDMLIVARAEHEGDIIPGKFVPSHGVTYVSYGGVEHSKDEYEILCGSQGEWVKAENGEVPPSAFEGGKSESGEILYIGRVFDGDSLMIGKVHPSHQVCYTPYGGYEKSYRDYEVLVV